MTPELVTALLQAVPSLAYALVIVWIWERQTKSNREREEADRKERGEREQLDRGERAAIEQRNSTERAEQAKLWQSFIAEQRELDRQHGLHLAEKIDVAMTGVNHRMDVLEQAVIRMSETSQLLTAQLKDTNTGVAALGRLVERFIGKDG